MTTPRSPLWPNEDYDPHYTRTDLRVECAVCGFAGIDPERTGSPEIAPFTLRVTGSTYAIPVGTPADRISQVVDKEVETVYGAYATCPFCGSPRWADGSAPDLKW